MNEQNTIHQKMLSPTVCALSKTSTNAGGKFARQLFSWISLTSACDWALFAIFSNSQHCLNRSPTTQYEVKNILFHKSSSEENRGQEMVESHGRNLRSSKGTEAQSAPIMTRLGQVGILALR